MPVLHRGYREFLEMHRDVDDIYIFGEELIALFDHLYRKDLRALTPEEVQVALQIWGYSVKIANLSTLRKINRARNWVIMPNEDESQHIVKNYLQRCTIELGSVFLRRDRHSSEDPKEVNSDCIISPSDFDCEIIGLAEQESWKSSDWWRRVGAIAIRDKEVLVVAHNRHVPSPHIPYAFGDPRSNFTRGVNVELSTALHAEAGLISEAARLGIVLQGASLFVTTFPCPPCAKLVAYSGFSKLFFRGGYAVLDGESILRSQSVEIIQIK